MDSRPGAVGRHPRMDADEQGDENHQGDRAMERAEQATEPPGRLAEECETDGVAEGEHLTDDKVNDEAGGACPVGVRGDDGAQDEG